jgi:hypothetical protein
MAKGKRTKRQTTIYKTLHRNLKIKQHEHQWPMVSRSCSTSCTCCVALALFFFLLPLCCMFFYLRLLITPLVSCGHCVVCSSIYGFWLLLWNLVAIVLSVLLFTASNYSVGILWPLCCLFFYLRLLITPLVSCGHCVVCSFIYGFWLLLWYLVAIVLSVLLFTSSDYEEQTTQWPQETKGVIRSRK